MMVEFNKEAVSLLVLSELKSDLEEKLEKPVDVVHAPLPKESLIKVNKLVYVYE